MNEVVLSVAFAVLIAIVILFQAALALGAPWGAYAMGGKFPGTYPPSMRVACIVQIAILASLASIVLSDSGVMFPGWSAFAGSAIWFVVAFSALATILNLITRSVWERRIWAPVSVLMLITSVLVALE